MDLNEIQIFTAVVKFGSFTTAAARLGLTKATVSRKLADLETRLGVRLLHRTTRQLNLTDPGRTFYERCSRIIADLEEAQTIITDDADTLRGHLKVVIPIELGQMLLGSFIGDFLQRYPDVDIDAELTNRHIDMVQEGVDIYIGVGIQNVAAHQHRRFLGCGAKRLVASRDYLQQHGQPSHPEQLTSHQCIQLLPTGSSNSPWVFKKEHHQHTIQPNGRLQCNNVTFAREAILSGYGLGVLPQPLIADFIASGELVPLLSDWQLGENELYANYHARQFTPKLLTVFLDEVSSLVNQIQQLQCSGPRHVLT